jgi:hypothetical protein
MREEEAGKEGSVGVDSGGQFEQAREYGGASRVFIGQGRKNVYPCIVILVDIGLMSAQPCVDIPQTC